MVLNQPDYAVIWLSAYRKWELSQRVLWHRHPRTRFAYRSVGQYVHLGCAACKFGACFWQGRRSRAILSQPLIRSALWDTVTGCVVAWSWDTVASGFPFGVWDAFFEQDQRKRPRSAAAALGCAPYVGRRGAWWVSPPGVCNPPGCTAPAWRRELNFHGVVV